MKLILAVNGMALFSVNSDVSVLLRRFPRLSRQFYSVGNMYVTARDFKSFFLTRQIKLYTSASQFLPKH